MKNKVWILETGVTNPSDHFFYLFSTKQKAIDFYTTKRAGSIKNIAFEDEEITQDKYVLLFKGSMDSGEAQDLYA